MTITKDQALECLYVHEDGCTFRVGPRGGEYLSIKYWKKNGVVKVWKRRPSTFSMPVKRGFIPAEYRYITPFDQVHLPKDCPALKARADYHATIKA